MKRFVAVCLATGAVGVAFVPVASAGSSSPPECWGQEVSAAASSLPPGTVGDSFSDYAHFLQTRPGENLGHTGIVHAKALCPTPPPPPPGG